MSRRKKVKETDPVKLRIANSINDPLYLISADLKDNLLTFEVEGTTQKIYKTTFDNNKFKCTCTDYCIRKRLCKHGYFIIGKILKNTQLLYSLTDINFDIFTLRPNIVNEFNQILYKTNHQCEHVSDEHFEADCVICFDLLTKDNKSCTTCRNKFHNVCLNIWLRTKNTCPLCRSIIKGSNEINEITDGFEKFKIST